MLDQTQVAGLTLAQIASRCAEESERFAHRQPFSPAFCHELFRRALQERDQAAWEYLHRQYQRLLLSWVQRHSLLAASGAEAEEVVNRAWTRLWQRVTPERFADFGELAALLRYLQMCIHSAIVDAARSQAAPPPPDPRPAASVEETVIGREQRRLLWDLVGARLRSEQERRWVYGAFVLGLKPRDLHAQYREVFPSVSDVYRTRDNVLGRLVRDPELQRLFGDQP